MSAKDFANAADLAQYVTDEGIAQADVVAIQVKDGRWWLFWF